MTVVIWQLEGPRWSPHMSGALMLSVSWTSHPLGPSLGSLGKMHRASWNIPRTRAGSCKLSSCQLHVYCVLSAKLNNAQIQVMGKLDHTPLMGELQSHREQRAWPPRDGPICSPVSSTTELRELLHEAGYWHPRFRQGLASGRILINTYCIEPD